MRLAAAACILVLAAKRDAMNGCPRSRRSTCGSFKVQSNSIPWAILRAAPVAEAGENLWRVRSQPPTAGCKPGWSRVVVEGDDRPDAFGMTTVDDAKVVVQGSLRKLPLIRLDTRPL